MAIPGIGMGVERIHSGSINNESISSRNNIENLSGGTNEANEGGDSKTFGELLSKLSQDANVAQLDADKKIQDVAVGRNKDLHGAMIAMEKADVQFRLLTQVRNKVLDAYREIMRMQA